MRSEEPFSRRLFLGGAAICLAVPRVAATQDAASYGLTALLDGSALARIPAGEFVMGSQAGDADEQPMHRVRITRPFEMGKFEVTQAQWETVITDPHARAGADRLALAGLALSVTPSYFKGPLLPVENVSWDDVQVFLKRLNARDRTHTYRLPTEAEWEYGCKAGTAGDDAARLAEKAWYKDNSGALTHPVGQKEPNVWGLYDMQGNVAEWVQDWYGHDYYAESPATDPPGPDSGSYRVFRGGFWLDPAKYCGATVRRFDFPVNRHDNVGFRVVRTARVPDG